MVCQDTADATLNNTNELMQVNVPRLTLVQQRLLCWQQHYSS